MKNMTFLAFFLITMTILLGCGLKFSPTEETIQKLEDAKNLFESQMENNMHPIIWAYLDEVLHDPDSFRLQRFEYQRGEYTIRLPYESKKHLIGKGTLTQFGDFIIFAYQVNIRYRARVPAGGMMLKSIQFYILKDKKIILPNKQIASLEKE